MLVGKCYSLTDISVKHPRQRIAPNGSLRMNNLRQREISQIAADSVSSPAIEHAALAEMSNMAAVAASRLQSSRALSAEDLRSVLGILRGIENIGLGGFLRRRGTEEGYRALGSRRPPPLSPPPPPMTAAAARDTRVWMHDNHN